ncbi:hypothetical protein C8A01DRAFT_50836 [Parachaetomium inaequale]|uniref:Uncharacterized protein n=1 Tax=Parachaetomium inaequale TaxID=2588326 RepID=A0AAN6SM40_9PEZI|nr:hypothetical protein C8A01DRAFT_50836 [Parachaetomium inaequale]
MLLSHGMSPRQSTERILSHTPSHLQYYSYPGYGVRSRETLRYSQAVRVGDSIECGGQGATSTLLIPYTRERMGPSTDKIHTEIDAQIDQAFANVDLNLKNAGGKGWSQVFKIRSYYVPLNDEAMKAMVRNININKYMPDHQRIWTVLSVVAHDPEAAARAREERGG